ncbi:alpha/beta fold hydrolase [Aquibacillus kalidii]|uniref:alpha/beta fold hydrolase n=1 Tax=Aquibacillus kalidii TaxID=2762597 RepID=UPI00164938DC|nr:alpha/beta hydrolase [Aquibacillus kalidii]
MSKFHSIVVGRGEPLLFLPAAGFSGIEGLNIAEHLADRFECHLLDMPGIGNSEGMEGRITQTKIAVWLKEYIEYKGFTNGVTVAGHSMGAALAMCLAVQYPTLVKKIVLLDQGHVPIPRFPTKDLGKVGLLVPLISGIERLLGDFFIKRIEKLFLSDEEEGNLSKEELTKQVRSFCERFDVQPSSYIEKAIKDPVPVNGAGLRLMLGYRRLRLPKMLNQLSVPCLLIFASKKRHDVKEAKNVERNIVKIRNTHVSLYEMDSHHYVHWSDEKCLEKIKGFLY